MRRVRVDEPKAALLASACGVAAAFSPASPTGSASTDVAVLAVAVATTTWLAASAPWWALATVGTVATLLGLGWTAVALGTAGAAIAFVVGALRSDLDLLRTGSAGCSLIALCHLGVDGFFGLSSLVGLSCGALLVGLGVARRKGPIRRAVRRVAIGLAAFAVLASIGAGAALLDARSDLVTGREFLEAGIEHVRDGDMVAATDDFRVASSAFDAADTAMSRPWAQPARLVPIVAQHRRAGSVASTAGERTTSDLAQLAAVVDIDALRPLAGAFDLDAITLLAGPVDRLQQTLHTVGSQIDDVHSAWLVGPVESQVAEANIEFDDNIDTFDQLALAVHRAPSLLGADQPRRYFVAFTTPAEARGSGGFMGNFAVMTADAGRVELADFGRTLDLNRGFGARTIDAPNDWLRRWGRYGFTNGPDGGTTSEPWSNITISPHFPSTGQVIASLFPQSGGSAIDGAFSIDPLVLQAFVGFTGPISIDGTDQQLNRTNTAQFLLFDQYSIDTDQRVDALEQVATATINDLLDGALPDIAVLADELGPLVEAERLVAWMADSADQALIEAVGMSGALPQLDGDHDGFSVVVNNAGANKLDAFLSRDFTYDAVYSTARGLVGTVEAELRITLTNSAPTSGLPDGVIGNYVGDAIGTNRSLITVYTSAPVTGVAIDGADVPTEGGSEASWNLTTFATLIPAGSSIEIVIHIDGAVSSATSEPGGESPAITGLIVRTQPLVDTPSYAIKVSGSDVGVTDYEGSISGSAEWSADESAR